MQEGNSASNQTSTSLISVLLLLIYPSLTINRLTLQHMWRTWLPSLMSSCWRKRNSFTIIALSIVFRLVSYINVQLNPWKEKKWKSLFLVQSLFWFDILPSRVWFFSFLSQPSPDSAAVRAWQQKKVLLYFSTVYQNKMESLPRGWQAARQSLYANDSVGWVGGGRSGAKPPCQGWVTEAVVCSWRSTII